MLRQIRTLLSMGICIGVLVSSIFILQPKKIDGKTSISMLNVGQGDSFLIQSANGMQVLIDGGKDSKVLSELARVMPRGDRSINVVIATHPDADHIGGLPLVLDRYNVGLFLTADVLTDTKTFTSLFETLKKKHIPSYYVRRGMTIRLDQDIAHQTKFSIIFPDRSTTHWETNHASVVGRLDVSDGVKNSSALFTGDSPISIERYLTMTYPRDIDVDILKIAHHGSKSSSSEEYLRAIRPNLALISAGVNNRYGHPHQEVTDRLVSLGIPWISTQERGSLTLETTGNTWIMKNK